MTDIATIEITPSPSLHHRASGGLFTFPYLPPSVRRRESESDLSTFPYPPTPEHMQYPQVVRDDVQESSSSISRGKFKPRGLYRRWHLALNWFAWWAFVGGLCFMACWFSMKDGIQLPIKILSFIGTIFIGQVVFISYAKFVWKFNAGDCGFITLVTIGQVLGPVLLVGLLHASYMGKL
ncbi:hypothetical protein TRVA0_019S00716 [Trichomonascus vanleenenianus]|uniref:uncharacterized protein n=1 Tax=Trichomonascus vanleenenianus TaxID=2268995 RepID=UPI003ECADA5F